MLDEQLAISERTLVTWAENIRALQALKRAGRTNEAAVLQARANRLKVENSVLTLRSQIVNQENAIRSLLLDPGASLERPQQGSAVMIDTVVPPVSIALVADRPDVRQSQLNLENCFYEVNVARSAFYPSINLSGSAGWTTHSGASVGSPGQWIANAVGSLVAPLFNRGSLTRNLKVAQADYEIAFLDFEQTLLDAGLEVNNAVTALETATGRIAIDRRQITTLQAAVRDTRLLMRNTNTNYLEVLTAQQRLLEAELAEANDRYAAVQARIALYRALGGGVDGAQ